MKNLNKIVYGHFRNKSLYKIYNYASPKTSYIDFFWILSSDHGIAFGYHYTTHKVILIKRYAQKTSGCGTDGTLA